MDSTNNANISIKQPEHIVRRTRVALIIVLYTIFFEDIKKEISAADINYKEILRTANVGKIKESRFNESLKAIIEDLHKIDEIIKNHAPKRPIEEIDKVVLSILRVSIFEGFVGKTVPPKVAINEALEISKELASLNQTQFISGLLGAVFSEHKEN
ncbi:hypothetical protein JW962_01800 [Candidatus Dojkabacteria bacterium]|nr:hypothetical protein [Candidatus Dojkabacteria bacterium]